MSGLEVGLLVVACFLVVLVFVLIAALVVVGVFAVRYGTMAREWEDNIDASLDMLDQSYQSLSQTLKTPLFVDSPEVRRVLADIAQARESVLLIADALQAPARSRRLRDMRDDE